MWDADVLVSPSSEPGLSAEDNQAPCSVLAPVPNSKLVHRDNQNLAMILVLVEETREKNKRILIASFCHLFSNLSLRVLFT